MGSGANVRELNKERLAIASQVCKRLRAQPRTYIKDVCRRGLEKVFAEWSQMKATNMRWNLEHNCLDD